MANIFSQLLDSGAEGVLQWSRALGNGEKNGWTVGSEGLLRQSLELALSAVEKHLAIIRGHRMKLLEHVDRSLTDPLLRGESVVGHQLRTVAVVVEHERSVLSVIDLDRVN